MNALKVIIYFSIFKYPLTLEEVFSFSSEKNIEDIKNQLQDLINNNIVFKFGNYYSDVNDASLVQRRLNGNIMAEHIMPKALKRGKLIMSFPFIESVSVSGALSKGYYDDDGDIDFFIITKPKYLWLARTLLILFKKLFLFNSKKYFCVNYFISSDHLKIAEQNKFTATELITLIPIYGKTVFNVFVAQNKWALDFYPNRTINIQLLSESFKKPIWSRSLEFLFTNKLGYKLNLYLKKLTLKKWKSKFKHLRKKEFEIALKSTNDVSKHHPQDFQTKVIGKLNERYDDKNKAYNLNLTMENA
ncbi:nucleotidyltransferase domain-containing protein [Winogradskyella echinorum]|uniref:Nucleotidyltransferase domain-containing protein n=1 Tax=Winogradskyella echinorum TaxID=538189 RepID=A0ABR6XYL5_9FLAO|nr:nucleotidyltransferase domain-containing protein [Winogradskyella echinorum]MBC3845566.1 nucleotidyltransferase domain-containing protein [Winogradskyella echinorum]MBC5749914.1 nucleotidyltransferase domain-containing protein [Winogradskyella echinorum]